MANILLDGQIIPIPNNLSDEDIKNILRPYFPEVVNCRINRKREEDEEVIEIIKIGGTKGSPMTSVLKTLKEAPSEPHPTLQLAVQLKAVELTQGLNLEFLFEHATEIEKCVNESYVDLRYTRTTILSLTEAKAIPALLPQSVSIL